MAQNIEEFRNSIPVGDLGIIPLQSCSELGNMVNEYIVDWRKERESVLHQDDKIKDSYIVNTKCSRFGSGEAKGTILDSIRGKDLYLLVDVTNYSIEYSLCGHMNKMSPDDHYSDLKRIITAAAGKARRINVIMPFLYESRQHKRTSRESLDCAVALQELHALGVEGDALVLGVDVAAAIFHDEHLDAVGEGVKAQTGDVLLFLDDLAVLNDLVPRGGHGQTQLGVQGGVVVQDGAGGVGRQIVDQAVGEAVDLAVHDALRQGGVKALDAVLVGVDVLAQVGDQTQIHVLGGFRSIVEDDVRADAILDGGLYGVGESGIRLAENLNLVLVGERIEIRGSLYKVRFLILGEGVPDGDLGLRFRGNADGRAGQQHDDCEEHSHDRAQFHKWFLPNCITPWSSTCCV